MEYSGFDYDAGDGQLRSEPENFAQDGDYALVLGHDYPNQGAYLRIGDYVSVWQSADIGATKILKMRVRARGPSYAPGDTQWVFSVWVDGVEQVSTRRVAAVNTLADYVDIAVNLAGLAGNHSIALVLRLEEV